MIRRVASGLLAVRALTASAAAVQPARPTEPIAAIVEAFRTHQVVAVSEDHGNQQCHLFRLALVRDPRFTSMVNDVVVEFGNARYQDVADRYVNGEEIPKESLRRIWWDTTQANGSYDRPIYEEFFKAVRAVNASLPRKRRLRVLLGDPPVDWDAVRDKADFDAYGRERDSYPADLIRREVLARGRRALLLYGGMHLQRLDLFHNFEESSWIVGRLEGASDTKVFSVWCATSAELSDVQADVASWRVPSLAHLPGTTLGAADFTAYYPFDLGRYTLRNGMSVSVPRENWRHLPMEDQFDAVLYLGPLSKMTMADPSPGLCADPCYVEIRTHRMRVAGFPQRAIDDLTEYCASTPSAR